jgi:predicted pyridoxine 5'-phosphate oxidase superfamily flavin-nucleotide-binding protein
MLTDEMIRAIETIDLFPFATASWESLPNVVPVKYLGVIDRERLWITDNFLSKSLQNLDENPYAAVYVITPDYTSCWQLKGKTCIHQEGQMFDAMRERVHHINPNLPAKSLVVLSIEEIYECLPGHTAGQLISKKNASSDPSGGCIER